MAPEFTRCTECGIIFQSTEGETQCPKCCAAEESAQAVRDKSEMLRFLKNLLRDAQAAGEFLTVVELSKRTGIEEAQIWEFIHSGEIDTASFDDPHVRDFLVRKRREQAKAKITASQDSDQQQRKKRSGFHSRHGDERKR
jgi:hypothetical protein